MCIVVVVSDCSLFDDSTFHSFLTIFSLITCPSFCPSTSSNGMWWTNSLCTTGNEDFGTLAEYDPLTLTVVCQCLLNFQIKTKTKMKNVDPDQVRTVRTVESGQSIGLFTQREVMDIDFRVSRLPHAVVKQAEKFSCSRTREEDRESFSSRSTASRFPTKQRLLRGYQGSGDVDVSSLLHT